MSWKKNLKRGCWNSNWDVSKVRKKKLEWRKDVKKENGKKIETGEICISSSFKTQSLLSDFLRMR